MSFLSEYVQTLYNEDIAIPVSQVKSALQTQNCFMWFAGHQGLMRYDGMGTKLFTTANGVAAISPDGTLAVHPALNNVFSTHIAYFGGEQPTSLFVSENEEVYIGTAGNTAYITAPRHVPM